MQNEENNTNKPARKADSLGLRAYLIIAAMIIVMLGLLVAGWLIWFSVDTEMDPFVWWLIGGAILISVALGSGLTFLLSHSSRHHDHKVYAADHFKKWERK